MKFETLQMNDKLKSGDIFYDGRCLQICYGFGGFSVHKGRLSPCLIYDGREVGGWGRNSVFRKTKRKGDCLTK